MTVWRVQLKPEPQKGISYSEVLEFCRLNEIIGVGWCLVQCVSDLYDDLKEEIYSIPEYKGEELSAVKAINAIRNMKKDDLVWTRIGGDASEYYLCRVGDKLWTDRVVTDIHKQHDIGNFVSARWLKIGKEDRVPGKVVNSFCVSGTAQRVNDVEEISKTIWNIYTTEEDKYILTGLRKEHFWNMIGSEELECLIMLYLQNKGYYIYSSTLKLSTAMFEAVLTHKDGKHLAYPQVKRNVPLLVEDYIGCLSNENDLIYLFTTSEEYGCMVHSQVKTIKKSELEEFIREHRNILPQTIVYWLNAIDN